MHSATEFDGHLRQEAAYFAARELRRIANDHVAIDHFTWTRGLSATADMLEPTSKSAYGVEQWEPVDRENNRRLAALKAALEEIADSLCTDLSHK